MVMNAVNNNQRELFPDLVTLMNRIECDCRPYQHLCCFVEKNTRERILLELRNRQNVGEVIEWLEDLCCNTGVTSAYPPLTEPATTCPTCTCPTYTCKPCPDCPPGTEPVYPVPGQPPEGMIPPGMETPPGQPPEGGGLTPTPGGLSPIPTPPLQPGPTGNGNGGGGGGDGNGGGGTGTIEIGTWGFLEPMDGTDIPAEKAQDCADLIAQVAKDQGINEEDLANGIFPPELVDIIMPMLKDCIGLEDTPPEQPPPPPPDYPMCDEADAFEWSILYKNCNEPCQAEVQNWYTSRKHQLENGQAICMVAAALLLTVPFVGAGLAAAAEAACVMIFDDLYAELNLEREKREGYCRDRCYGETTKDMGCRGYG